MNSSADLRGMTFPTGSTAPQSVLAPDSRRVSTCCSCTRPCKRVRPIAVRNARRARCAQDSDPVE